MIKIIHPSFIQSYYPRISSLIPVSIFISEVDSKNSNNNAATNITPAGGYGPPRSPVRDNKKLKRVRDKVKRSFIGGRGSSSKDRYYEAGNTTTTSITTATTPTGMSSFDNNNNNNSNEDVQQHVYHINSTNHDKLMDNLIAQSDVEMAEI